MVPPTLLDKESFKIADKEYYANDDGITRIPIQEKTTNLVIAVNQLTNDLINGIYYLNLNTCNYNNICSNTIRIPCNINNTTIPYKFKVEIIPMTA